MYQFLHVEKTNHPILLANSDLNPNLVNLGKNAISQYFQKRVSYVKTVHAWRTVHEYYIIGATGRRVQQFDFMGKACFSYYICKIGH